MDPRQYVWAVFTVGSQILPAALWVQAGPRMAADPSLRPGYSRLIRGFAVWLSAPGYKPTEPDFLDVRERVRQVQRVGPRAAKLAVRVPLRRMDLEPLVAPDPRRQ